MKNKIINLINADDGFIKQNNFKIIELTDGICILEYKIKKDGLNPMGIVHGGLLFGFADTCAGLLAGMTGKTQLTTSSSINYLSPAKSGKIYAYAKKLKEGKNIGYYEVEIKDENDKLLAISNVNMFFVQNNK